MRIKDVVAQCLKFGLPAAALTDKNNLFGSLEYSLSACAKGVQPIIGIDLIVEYPDNKYKGIVLLAQTESGYQNLLRIASNIFLSRRQGKPLSATLDEVLGFADGLIALVANPIDSIEFERFSQGIDDIFEFIPIMHKAFNDRLYMELIRPEDQTQNAAYFESLVLEYAHKHDIPIVATNAAACQSADFVEAQDALHCIASGRYLIEENRTRLFNGQYFKSADEMVALFQDLPEATRNSVLIAQRCNAFPESKPPLLPRFSDDPNADESIILQAEARAGLKRRMLQTNVADNVQDQYIQRLNFELEVINKMQYPGYFLIVSDFIRWSKEHGIPVGPGRGSGAGSIVAWALDITDLDPIRFGLLFERFLNPERVSMPDFDIDFCQERREEVIAYVQQKYGADKVGQIITYGKLQTRAVLRDVGRVLQMPYGLIDSICKMVPNNPANPITLEEAITLDKGLQEARKTDADIDKLLTLGLKLEGITRHVSTHAAGIVIADRPIIELAPLYLDEGHTMPAVQYSMKYAESAGLIKFDFLGLKTLTVIAWTQKLLAERGVIIDFNSMQFEDKNTYDLLSSGATTGVFQFESAGMKDAIKRLKPDSIVDLIALGSLYRPGPMDNIPSYINRKHGLAKPEYLHPLMEPILQETYGIIVYQEQVMEIARVLAGFSLGGADLLRRAMGKKIKAEMEAQRETFVQGCIANGISHEKATEIFALIEKFASYGFNKSHAAAYAVISYQTAYLKANYTKEFLVASINSEIHDTDKINLFLEEAKKFKIPLLLPDINKSEARFCIEDDCIRYGLGAIKNVGMSAIEKAIEERKNNGDFKDVYDLLERLEPGTMNKRMLENLALSGSLDCLCKNRKFIVLNSQQLIKYAQEYHTNKNNGQFGLFADASGLHTERPYMQETEDFTFSETLQNEFAAIGFYLSQHPLANYTAKIAKLGVTLSHSVENYASVKGTKLSVAGVITSRKVKSSKRGKYAFIQISDTEGLIELSIFNDAIIQNNQDLLEVGKSIFANIDVRSDDNGTRITVDSIKALEEATSNIQTAFKISIKDINAIDALSKIVSYSGGRPLYLSIDLGFAYVMFTNKDGCFIADGNEEKLRSIQGIEIMEV